MKNLLRALAAISVLACLVLSCEVAVPPAILSFKVLDAQNPGVVGLTSDVTGIVDEANRVITVKMPVAVASYAGIKPSIATSDGASVTPNAAATQDFSTSPFRYVVENAAGEQVVYSVVFKKAVTTVAAATAVQISEVYCGSGTPYKGYNNRWIEITNTSGSAVELEQYDLALRTWESGVRRADRDVVVPLRGTLPAGASLVIYSARINSSTFSAVTGLGAPDLKSADTSYNSICEFDGDDGLQLLRDGVTLDAVGPNGGAGNGMKFLRAKRFLRKNGKAPTAAYLDRDWIAYAISQTSTDAANVGALTPVMANDNTNLTFFGLEGLAQPEYGIIDATAGTVQIGVPQGTDVRNLVVSFSTEGQGVTYAGSPISSGVTRIDFSSPRIVTVWAPNNSTRNYAVSVVQYGTLDYVTTNYGFDGNILAKLNEMKIPPAGSTRALSGYIEGILTAKNVLYKYGSTTYETCFFIQDQNEGMFVWTPNMVDYPLGSKLRVEVTLGVINYSQPTIIGHGEIRRVDPYIYDIYYKTGTWNANADLNKVFRWAGTVAESADGYNEGKFTLDPLRMYQVTDDMTAWVKGGVTGSFYGPILVSYSKYKMCLSERVQVR